MNFFDFILRKIRAGILYYLYVFWLAVLHFQVEYIIVKFDHANKTAKVRLCAQDILYKLNEKEANDPE